MTRRALAMVTVFCVSFCVACATTGQAGAPRPQVLWVQDVNGQALYWVNDRPVGRAPLSGLGPFLGSIQKDGLIVILDSRVPINEIAGIEGILEKLPYKGARYFVYVPELPDRMSEIIWKSEDVPLPQKPPSTYREGPSR